MIGIKIQNLRKEQKLSLRALAEKAGISKSTLSDIENGKTNPTTNTLNKLASALNISIEDLFKSKPITDEKIQEWDKKYKDKINNEVAVTTEFEPTHFKTAEAAMKFILEQPVIMSDLNLEDLSDQDKINFSNDLYDVMKWLAPKYKK